MGSIGIQKPGDRPDISAFFRVIFLEAIDLFNHLHGDHNPKITEAMWSLWVMQKHIHVEEDYFVFHGRQAFN